jgi:hypothetical protein
MNDVKLCTIFQNILYFIYIMADTKKQKNTQRAAGKNRTPRAVSGKQNGGKKPVQKPDNTTQPQREALAKELRALIPRLDAEGLSFLIEQAQVYLYNMQVEELNAVLARPGKGGGKRAAPPETFRIEGSSSSYYLVYNNEWIMFAKDEMLHIAKIAASPGTELEIRKRLYNWLVKERRDVLKSISMADKFDPKMTELVKCIKKTFTVRYK